MVGFAHSDAMEKASSSSSPQSSPGWGSIVSIVYSVGTVACEKIDALLVSSVSEPVAISCEFEYGIMGRMSFTPYQREDNDAGLL